MQRPEEGLLICPLKVFTATNGADSERFQTTNPRVTPNLSLVALHRAELCMGDPMPAKVYRHGDLIRKASWGPVGEIG